MEEENMVQPLTAPTVPGDLATAKRRSQPFACAINDKTTTKQQPLNKGSQQ